MSEKRKFHLTDIAGVTTGRILKPGGFGGIQDVVIFMNRWDSCYTTQTIEGANNCIPELKRQLPWLAELDDDPSHPISKMTPQNYMEYVAHWIVKHGEWHEIEPMPLDDTKPATNELTLLRRIRPDVHVTSINPDGEIVPTLHKPDKIPPSNN